MGSASLESAPSRPRVHDCQNACGQHMGFLGQKKGGCKEGVARQHTPTTFSNSRPKMGRKWVKPVGVLNTDLPALWPNIWRSGPPLADPVADP